MYPNLEGPVHDIDAMRALLTQNFGFPNDDKHIHILLDKAATHDAILKAMQQYLVKDPNPGDTVVLYVSSHGSLRVDPNADPKRHCQRYDLDGTGLHPSCMENTIVPYDWYLGHDDIFSRDLRHIFNQAADRGIHLTAIFDSCHSGSLARGATSMAQVARDFVFDPRPMPDDPYPAEATGIPPESRKDNPVLVLSAAQKDQSAMDVLDARPPHGLFTDALVETLKGLPANRPVSDVFKRLQVAMELAPYAANQQPQLDASEVRKEQPLFGGAAGSGPPTAVIVSADDRGVVLDIGTIADIGKGSEFTEVTEINGVRAVLQVTDSIGLARSKASVISPVRREDASQRYRSVDQMGAGAAAHFELLRGRFKSLAGGDRGRSQRCCARPMSSSPATRLPIPGPTTWTGTARTGSSRLIPGRLLPARSGEKRPPRSALNCRRER